MSYLVANPYDRFSRDEAHFIDKTDQVKRNLYNEQIKLKHK